jgi:hypothetical protein
MKFGYEATAIFRNLPLAHMWPDDAVLIKRMLQEPMAFQNLHVRWIISVVPWPPRYDMKLVQRFGNVHIYSVAAGQGPPVRLKGPGELDVLQFSDEQIRVRVTGATEASRILYPIAYYYPWQAYHEGEPAPIALRSALPNTHAFLMTVPASDGVTELRYERPVQERLAGWTSFIFWILVIFGAGMAVFKRVQGGVNR